MRKFIEKFAVKGQLYIYRRIIVKFGVYTRRLPLPLEHF